MGLAIYPNDLLAPRDDSRLVGGGTVRHFQHAPRVDAQLREERDDPVAGGVLADHTAEVAACAEGHDVAHHVAGTAEDGGLVGHVNHRHRRLGAHAQCVAVEVLVEEGVSDHEHPQAREGVEQLLGAGVAKRAGIGAQGELPSFQQVPPLSAARRPSPGDPSARHASTSALTRSGVSRVMQR